MYFFLIIIHSVSLILLLRQPNGAAALFCRETPAALLLFTYESVTAAVYHGCFEERFASDKSNKCCPVWAPASLNCSHTAKHGWLFIRRRVC